MDLRSVTRPVHDQLAATAAVGDESTQHAAQMLSVALDPALRLALQEAVGQVAAEVSAELAPGRVDIALSGTQLEVRVQPPAAETPPAPDAEQEQAGAGASRVTFRPPQQLKNRLEQAASAEGLSLNAYLVRALTSHLDGPGPGASGWSRHGAGRTSGWFI